MTKVEPRFRELMKEFELTLDKYSYTIVIGAICPRGNFNEAIGMLDEMEKNETINGDATVIGGTYGFSALMEVFQNNLLQDLNVFKSLKAGGVGNSLLLKKLKEHYAYKLEKVLSDGTTAAAKKKKGLTARSIARTYMLYVLRYFLFPTKKGTDVSAWYFDLLAKDKVAKKWSWGSAVLAHMYYNLAAASRDDGRQFAGYTTLLEKWDVSVTDRYGGTALLKFREALDNYKLEDVTTDDDVGIHQRKEASVNEHGDTPMHQSEDVAEQYDASHHEHASLSPNAHDTMPIKGGSGGFNQQITALNGQLLKLKEDKEKEFEANINLKDALKEKCKESELLKAVNTFLMELIDLHLPPATLLVVLQSHQHVPDVTLAKKYDDLLSAHEDVKKKLIAKEDFRKKLLNTEERMKSLEVNNSEWEVWRQALKKALASEGMGDMGDPTFKELFEQKERFFTIAQQGTKGDYQENLVFTAVTLKNVVIARREKMAKKKKILVFQPWMKYLVDACSYGHQNVEYRHMAYLLSSYYEKVVAFISHTEAYTFLPLFWARKRNTTSNDERFQNLLMDTSKYWWFGLGADNHYIRLFPRFDAPIPLVSTLFYSYVNLEIPLTFVKEQLT
ncbi:hypothetical protein GIB67_027602, partial [Kingdonia uniflora]